MSSAGAGDSPLLLLFDIDGTLLGGATRAHRDALHAALLEVHGVDALGLREPPSPAGRTDGEIARLILRAAGVAEAAIDARAPEVMATCCARFAALCEENLSHTVLPGVHELLEELSRRDGLRLALLTGNYEPVARRKLAAARIGDFFVPGVGGFGSDAEDRRRLPAIARERSGEGSLPHPRSRTVVIGDTPRDIACARADQVRCVAVATGQFGVAELRDADAVAARAAEVEAVLEELLQSR